MNDTSPLGRIRTWLDRSDFDALIVPSADPHQSEYPPSRFLARAWASGFAGSAGTLVVTRTDAALWTDSRYYLEAEQAVADRPIELQREGLPQTPSLTEWLARHLYPGGRVAIDGRTVTPTLFDGWNDRLRDSSIEVIAVADPFESIRPERPQLPARPIFALAAEDAAGAPDERLARLRARLREADTDWHVIATLDDIAWLLTLRGSDVEYNPVFLAFLVVGSESATLFCDDSRIDAEARTLLDRCGVAIMPYESCLDALSQLSGRVLVDPDRTSCAIRNALEGATVVTAMQPTTMMKACKEDAELANTRVAMRRDGVAMVRFLAWLDDRIDCGAAIDELTAAQQLTAFRAEGAKYLSDSFAAVSAFGSNGAIVHYRPSEDGAASIEPSGVYLIDSGGQYRDGTTDITRTVAVGTPPAEAVDDATAVLRAHIALATLRFPTDAVGSQLDAIARGPLWRELKTYGHGTGHGVGYVLNVHEGPQRLAPHAPPVALQPGMIVSCEPGLYRTGRWGVRLENLVAVRTAGESEFGRFLEFEVLTLCPFDRRMIDPAHLSALELGWLNEYHERVRDVLSPLVSGHDREWLIRATEPIG